MRIFLDTCVWIYLVEDSGKFREAAELAIFSLSEEDELVSSELVRFECLVGTIKKSSEKYKKEHQANFSKLEFAELRRSLFDKAAEIRASTGIKPLDSLHLAAAIVSNCGEFWTNDKRLKDIDDQINIRVIS